MSAALSIADVLPTAWADVFSAGHPRIGLGLDLGTTTHKKSNPSALAVVQQVAHTYFARLLVRWKTADPNVTRGILRAVLGGLPHGLRARRLCIDATSERFFATDLRTEFAGLVPVELVIASESTTYGGESMSMKVYLGNLLINTIEDGYLALPPEGWVKTDFRQVVRDRGTFTAEVLEDGGHADVFGAVQNALHALVAKGGPTKAGAAGTTRLRVRSTRPARDLSGWQRPSAPVPPKLRSV